MGVSFTKGLSIARNIPMVEVNHLQGHILSHFIDLRDRTLPHPDFPFLCLLVSGGHTQIVRVDSPLEMEIIGTTIDDAAGEAFDKCAKVMGLPYPGGKPMDELARQSQGGVYDLPRAHVDGADLDMSFSGLKTAVVNLAHNAQQKGEPLDAAALALPAARLSGGQKRRTALLRALWAPSDTLLLDEPFTGMDPDTLAAAAALLRERCGEKPVLLATHDREAIRLLGWPVVELENA